MHVLRLFRRVVAVVPLLLLIVSSTPSRAQQPAQSDSTALRALVEFLAVSEVVAATDEGPAMAGANATVQKTQDEGRQVVIAQMANDSLPPGDYAVRAVVYIDGRAAGRVARTLRKIGI